MSFSWSTVNQYDKMVIAPFNEVRTNTNTLCSNLGISAYSWSHLPVAQLTLIEYEDLMELRNALDYVHNNNTCTSNNAAADSGYQGTYRATDNASAQSTQHSGDDSGAQATYNSTVNPNADSGANANADSGALSGQNSGVNNSQRTAVNPNADSAADNPYNATVYNPYNNNCNSNLYGYF